MDEPLPPLRVTQAGRLDVYLARQLPALSRSQLQKLIAAGHVRLNSQVCQTKKTPVHPGDTLEVWVPPAAPLEAIPQPLPLHILYEDELLLVVNKPAGLVVHPAPGHWDGTLVNALLAHCDHLPGIGGRQRPGIVHRLDKDTSGALVVAKTDFAQAHLQAQLQAKTARREYLGVVHGTFSPPQGTIDLPLGRHPLHRQRMAVLPERGRSAVTHWQVQEHLGNYSLVSFRLETGRTHQIRVHSAHLGHPLVGDPLYGPGRPLGVNLTGQVLHAWQLEFIHPGHGELVRFVAPCPQEFVTLLAVLRQRQKS